MTAKIELQGNDQRAVARENEAFEGDADSKETGFQNQNNEAIKPQTMGDVKEASIGILKDDKTDVDNNNKANGNLQRDTSGSETRVIGVVAKRPDEIDKTVECEYKVLVKDSVVFEDEEFEHTKCSLCIDKTHTGFVSFLKNRKKLLVNICLGLLAALFIAYFTYVCVTNWEGSIGLAVLFAIFIVIGIVKLLFKFCKPALHSCWDKSSSFWNKHGRILQWVVYVVLLVALVVFIALDVARDVRRLISLLGLALLVFITFIFSNNPARVKWRPVIWGLVLQLLFGLIVLRWPPGRRAVEWFADQVVIFLAYADEGSKFVFGEEGYLMHPFAFQSLPVVVFFSSVISILYHWGMMQGLIRFLATVMQLTMGTTALESLASVSNIFVSYVEVAPMTMPYLQRLTKSEIHAILTSGFATAAGSILAIYVHAGAPAEHLIPACIVSAPAAMAIAKLSYPETKVSLTRHQRDVGLPKGKERNFIEAAANGSMLAVSLVAGIVVCLISFIAIVSFLNGVLSWLGGMAGYPELSFQIICSYVFWPLVVLMGVEVADARRVASQMGLKIFLDDVLCYADLGEAIKDGAISERSTVIATYACCGFGSVGAMGVAMGAMLALSPQRKGTIAHLVPRALVNGNIAAFMTACVAGLLYDTGDAYTHLDDVSNSTLYNTTTSFLEMVTAGK